MLTWISFANIPFKMPPEYLKIIYKYYPKDIVSSDLKYSYTPEMGRYFEMEEAAKVNNQEFEALIADITQRYGYFVMDQSLYGVFDPVYRSNLHIPDSHNITAYSVCIIMVSVLAPFYVIYLTQSYAEGPNSLLSGPVTNEEKVFISEMERVVNYYFPGHKPFPMEYFNVKVPRISSGSNPFEEATYFECLITNFIQ